MIDMMRWKVNVFSKNPVKDEWIVTYITELLECVQLMLQLIDAPSLVTLRDHVIPGLSLSQPGLTLQMLQNTGLSATAAATPLLIVLVKNNMMKQAINFGRFCPSSLITISPQSAAPCSIKTNMESLSASARKEVKSYRLYNFRPVQWPGVV